ncbi:MAG TPA: hypothetical protein VFZ17_07955 [Acidimicrobiia bacterium]|nr:hypothetical protein [Acidimicrobiia bacterium]
MDVDGYVVEDDFFGKPYIDVDEQRTDPLPHRFVHGGFEGTDTRFTFYFPPADVYRGRLLQPIEGGLGGQESFHGTPVAQLLGMGMHSVFRLGGFMVESNQGHIGPSQCAKAGDDATIYAYRATAESARLSKYVAAQVYGAPPEHAYIYGGGGGASRGSTAFTNTDVWDGAFLFDGAGPIGPTAAGTKIAATGWGQYAAWIDVVRAVGPRIADVVDATGPGGSGDPFTGLSVDGREALATLYRMGFPRGAESMIPWASAAMSVWAWSAEDLATQDPGYTEAFWSEAGFAGHDRPSDFADDLMNGEVTVVRTWAASDVLADARFAGTPGSMRAGFYPADAVLAVEVEGVRGKPLGARVEIVDGAGAGRVLYCNSYVDSILFADATGETGIVRFQGVEAGDTIRLDNRAFLAFGHYYRHHVAFVDPQYEPLIIDGAPVYPQRQEIFASSFVGAPRPASYAGKMLWSQHTHDASVWPGAIVPYDHAVRENLGDEAADRWALRYVEYGENLPPIMIGGTGTSSGFARFIDWRGQVEQGIEDVIEWVEHDVVPASTSYRYEQGRLTLPDTAAERGGIQPVVRLTANGSSRAEIALGEAVELEVHAEVPDGQGTLILLEWDPEGTGTYVSAEPALDGTTAKTVTRLSYTYATRGTHLAGVRVTAHRTGDVNSEFARVINLGRARVVVT